MTHTSASLDTFDFLELLYLLTDQGRSGVLTVFRPDGQFQAWIENGTVRQLEFGRERGTKALVMLMSDPRGRFQFDEGITHPNPLMEAPLDEVTLEVLELLPPSPLGFDGPARFTSRERLNRLRWTLREQNILRLVDAQRPVSEISEDPEARRLLEKLHRIGLLTSRKSRVARLTVTVTREVRGVVLVDDLIFKRWKEDMVRHPQSIAVRADSGEVYTLPVRSGSNLAALLMVPAELLMRTGLHAGDSVLVRPL
ncbi:hypothetical protein HNQ07_000584 [Deinococcus metalli]|uniref:PatA-like N-terminal domain-containing protein n=1 Tax=Deinococcus metalli TaxID=1141878 RepID=A0A7W8NNX0_9DEIO|nr:DUF4388 domain-containing protein [Deinococcus metalli]MBB5375140.1 hypothetical protein [Deinococcus metalli]GHF31372.1 hypothetical protein GCM10017781_04580 [Deinococcus metalli]